MTYSLVRGNLRELASASIWSLHIQATGAVSLEGWVDTRPRPVALSLAAWGCLQCRSLACMELRV